MIPQPLCSPRALNKHAQQLFCSLHRRKSEKNQFVAVVVHQLLWQFKRVLSIPVSLHTLVLLFVAQTQLFRDLLRQIFNKFPVVLLRGSAQAVAAHASGQDGMFLAVVVAIDERLTTLYHPVVPSRHRLVVFFVLRPIFCLEATRIQLNPDHVENADVQVLPLETGSERLEKWLAVLNCSSMSAEQ